MTLYTCPRKLLAHLQPTKSLLCIVAHPDSLIGMAVSDPYLASARPLSVVHGMDRVEEAVRENGVGGILGGLPMIRDGDLSSTAYKKHHALDMRARDELLKHAWKVTMPLYSIDKRYTLAQAREAAQNDPWMWEEIDLEEYEDGSDSSPSIEAGVALNFFLWEHTEGWQNTFG
jgi:RNase H-fold protein (predicted Holliday junction resolvase)